jgi:glycogen debranching enzyme
MSAMDFTIRLQPEEKRNPARTKHAILKCPQASWAQSVFSVPLGSKVVPNRDYPYEGLSVLLEGENYHFLDGLAAGLKKDGAYVPLVATRVSVWPWKMRYTYENRTEDIQLDAWYYLLQMGAQQEGITACVSLESNASSVIIEPLVDIRHMYAPSAPGEQFCTVRRDGMLISRDDKLLSIRAAQACELRAWRKELEWWYKLGSGFRQKTEHGPAFKGERKTLVSFGELEIPLRHASNALLVIACSNAETELERLHERGVDWQRDEAAEEEKARAIVHALGPAAAEPAVAFRALALAKFGMYVRGNFFYEAGEFWFRTPWFRDLFEGIIHNIETLVRIGDADKIKAIIRDAFEYQDECGRIPNRFPERSGASLDYNNADATLLAFIAAGELLKRHRDDEFASRVLDRAAFTIEQFAQNELQKINGAPVLHANGLVTVVPWHSWTDSSREVAIHGSRTRVSVRIPESWFIDVEDEMEASSRACAVAESLNMPRYYLPEINAQWIAMLRHCVTIANKLGTDPGTFSMHLEQAKASFKTVFWDAAAHLLHNVVTIEGKADKTPGSPAVVAMALLLDEAIFSPQEVAQFIDHTKANLLVTKNGLPFGILVKQSAKSTYLGDDEYHEAVVWPRDTPYLIRLLRYAGDRERGTVDGLLRSNLAHQMDEGFVFYTSELFSPDDGAMTPVKNPVQFWSQWVDPFLKV